MSLTLEERAKQAKRHLRRSPGCAASDQACTVIDDLLTELSRQASWVKELEALVELYAPKARMDTCVPLPPRCEINRDGWLFTSDGLWIGTITHMDEVREANASLAEAVAAIRQKA